MAPSTVPATAVAPALVPAPAEEKKVYDVAAPAFDEAAPPSWWRTTLYAAAGSDDDYEGQLVLLAAPPPPADKDESAPAVSEGPLARGAPPREKVPTVVPTLAEEKKVAAPAFDEAATPSWWRVPLNRAAIADEDYK